MEKLLRALLLFDVTDGQCVQTAGIKCENQGLKMLLPSSYSVVNRPIMVFKGCNGHNNLFLFKKTEGCFILNGFLP